MHEGRDMEKAKITLHQTSHNDILSIDTEKERR